MADAKFLKLARDRFKLAQEARKKQHDRELDDIDFYNGDQWPDDVKTIRKGTPANAQNGMPPVPARPMITINKTREPVRQVLNQERAADMGISITPADDFGDLAQPIDETEIQLREGLVRRIQRDSHAADARTWAYMRAVIAGVGYYSVMTRYVEGKTNDQEIYVHRFYDQSCVLLDPAHQQPDGSDAEWAFELDWNPWDVYVAEFPKRKGRKNDVCDYDNGAWALERDAKPEWFKEQGDQRMVLVVNYWFTERTSRELVEFALASDPTQSRVEWADDLEGDKADPALVETLASEGWFEVEDGRRTVVEKTIKWAKLDGCDDGVLEETDWLGPDMPIVKVLGEELQPVNGQRFVEGMVRAMREPAYGFNVMVSRLVELIGLAPLTPLLVEEGTVEGYEDWYAAANTRTLPYLPYKRTNLQDGPANVPTVPPSREPPIMAVSTAVQMFGEAVESTSGHPAPALGKVDPSVKSGRAIKALQEAAAAGSNHFMDNLKRSMEYEGRIINNLLYPVYGTRPGRIARIVNGEGDAEHVIIGKPMLVQNGRPVPAPQDNPNAKQYRLTKDAKFNVAIKVSPQKDTRRQQANAELASLIESNPEFMTWFGDLYLKTSDIPGNQEMADRAKVMLAPPIQQMLSAKQQGQDPQVAAALAQKDGTIQQLQSELQEASKGTAVEQLKQQGQTQRDAMDLDFQREKLAVESETKLAVAELGAKIERLTLFLEERARLGVEADAAAGRDHELGMAAMNAGVSAEQADAARQHEASESAAAREAAAAEGDAARQAAAEQAAMAARSTQ